MKYPRREQSETENFPTPRESFFHRTFFDIAIYERELTKSIEEFQATQTELGELKVQLSEAPTRPCFFCDGTCRNLSAIIEKRDVFGCLGGTYSRLEQRLSHGEAAPTQWECQDCGAFDIGEPTEAKTWVFPQKPGPKTVSRRILDYIPGAEGVGYTESSNGTVWMLKVDGTWFVLPGNSTQVIKRLQLRHALKSGLITVPVEAVQVKTRKSTYVHEPRFAKPSGQEVAVFEAEVELPCDQCHRTIQVGGLFTRSADKRGEVYGIRYTHCRDCVPFEVME